MAALEDIRKVKEIALSATCDPTMLVVDPSLSKRADGKVCLKLDFVVTNLLLIKTI